MIETSSPMPSPSIAATRDAYASLSSMMRIEIDLPDNPPEPMGREPPGVNRILEVPFALSPATPRSYVAISAGIPPTTRSRLHPIHRFSQRTHEKHAGGPCPN